MLTGRINELLAKVEELGCQGNVDEAQGVMKLCDQLKEERDQLQNVRPVIVACYSGWKVGRAISPGCSRCPPLSLFTPFSLERKDEQNSDIISCSKPDIVTCCLLMSYFFSPFCVLAFTVLILLNIVKHEIQVIQLYVILQSTLNLRILNGFCSTWCFTWLYTTSVFHSSFTSAGWYFSIISTLYVILPF